MKTALIQHTPTDGKYCVVNTAVFSEACPRVWFDGKEDCWVVPIGNANVSIGDLYTPVEFPITLENISLGGTFISQTIVKIVPEEITLFQARAILRLNGYYETVDAFMQSDNANNLQRDAWITSPIVPRVSDTVDQIQALLNLTDGQMDDLFIEASHIHI